MLVAHFTTHDKTTVADVTVAGQYTRTLLHTHTISLANPLTHSLKLHTHTLSLVCLFSLLRSFACTLLFQIFRSWTVLANFFVATLSTGQFA